MKDTFFLDGEGELLCGAVAGFKLSVKFSLGKIELVEPPREFMENRMRRNAFTPLPVTSPTPTVSPFCRFIIAIPLTDYW